MDARTWWLVFNLVNVTATGSAAYFTCAELRRLRAANRIPSSVPSIADLEDINITNSEVFFVVNLGFMGLGLWLMVVAWRWGSSLPSFVPIGTGLFALLWVIVALWARKSHRRLKRNAAMQRQELDARSRA